jgi:hypothetical protein
LERAGNGIGTCLEGVWKELAMTCVDFVGFDYLHLFRDIRDIRDTNILCVCEFLPECETDRPTIHKYCKIALHFIFAKFEGGKN